MAVRRQVRLVIRNRAAREKAHRLLPPPHRPLPQVSCPGRAVLPSIPKRPQRRSPRRRLIAIGLAAVVCAAAAAVTIRTFRSSAPDPPALDSLGPLAPEIEDLVRQAREGVAQDPRDGTRWGRFGMVCEANGLTGAARDALRRTPPPRSPRRHSGSFTSPLSTRGWGEPTRRFARCDARSI